DRLGRAFTLSLSLFGGAVVTLIYIALSAVVAWEATLTLVVFAIVTTLAMSRFYKRSHAFGKSLAPLNAQLQAMLEEQFAGAKFNKPGGGVVLVITQAEPLVQKVGDVNTFATAMPGMVRALLEYIALIGVAIILVLTSAELGVAPGNVIIVLALFARLFPR